MHARRCRSVPVPACADGGLNQLLSSMKEGVIKRETTKTSKHQNAFPRSAVDCHDIKTLRPHVIAGTSGARGVRVRARRRRAVPVLACADGSLSQPLSPMEEGVIKRQNVEQEKQYSVIE